MGIYKGAWRCKKCGFFMSFGGDKCSECKTKKQEKKSKPKNEAKLTLSKLDYNDYIKRF